MSSFNIILGTAVFGKGDPIPGGLCDVNAIKDIIDTFCEYGYKELDTSRVYCKGTSEEILAEIEATNKCKVSTKVAPFPPGTFQPDRLKATFYESLKTLRLDKVDILYLHAPDHTVPIRDTLRAIQDLYEEGRFARFGLSNFASWQVSAVWEIMNERGWVKPTVYQGMYNALLRDAERELFPCLRRYNIRFYAHTILACGLLGHDYKGVDIHRTDNQEDAYSFGSSTWQSALYPGKYWNQYFFESVAHVHDVASKAGISPSDIAIRWLVYHSNLKPEFNDAIIIGATAVEHVRNNIKAVGQGPLPDSIVKALDRAWKAAMFQGPPYFV